MLEVLFLEIMNGIKELANFKRCPNGHTVDDDMRFCPICGAEITFGGIRFCPNCGKERQPTDKFCAQCGYPFIQQSIIQQPKEEKNDDFSFFGFLWID